MNVQNVLTIIAVILMSTSTVIICKETRAIEKILFKLKPKSKQAVLYTPTESADFYSQNYFLRFAMDNLNFKMNRDEEINRATVKVANVAAVMTFIVVAMIANNSIVTALIVSVSIIGFILQMNTTGTKNETQAKLKLQSALMQIIPFLQYIDSHKAFSILQNSYSGLSYKPVIDLLNGTPFAVGYSNYLKEGSTDRTLDLLNTASTIYAVNEEDRIADMVAKADTKISAIQTVGIFISEFILVLVPASYYLIKTLGGGI